MKIPERFGISSRHFVFLGTSFQNIFYGINSLPLMAIACDVCPKNLEATIISSFTSI